MKKLLSTSLILGLILGSTSLSAQYSKVYYEQKKEDYKEFIKNHEYSNRPHYTKAELKAIPKKDRPDLGNELNFLQTLDPSLGYVPLNGLTNAHKITDILQAQNKTSIPGITWTERGPDNVGGRTRAMIWDPNDPTGKTVIAGGVAGGIWINTDITSSSTQWTAVNNFWDNLAVTALAYDPSNTTTMYAGTGEGYYNVDAVRGGGIWKSTNGGTSWTRLGSTSSYTYITRIAVASNGDVYASTNGSGIIRSTNGGTSWTKVLGSGVGASTNRAADIKIGADGTLFAAMGIFSTDGIYSSSNGTSWTKLNTGSNGFPTSGIRRIEIGCAPSNANVIYCLVQGSGSAINAIYKSTNKGSTWTSVALPNDADTGIPANDFTRGQSWYDLSVAVDPNNSNTLFVGGIDLFKSTNGGSSWSQVSHWWGGYGFQEVHADQHAAVYFPGSSSKIVFGHDGGVSYSGNANAGMPTIPARNNGYNVTQYYAGAINGTSGSNNMIAGAQDNGTQKYTTAGMNSTSEVTGGDGAFCHIDQSNGNNQISQYVYNVVYRTTNNWGPGTSQISNSQSTGLFINPSDYDDKEDIYYSGHANGSTIRLKRITSPFGSATTGTVSIAGGSSDVSHISASPYASAGNSTVFVGTNGGDVYKVSNAQSGSPTVTNIGSALPSGNISCIAIGASEQQLLVTLSNYGTVSVWETSNGGTNWTSKEGNLPNMPVRWALYNPLDYNQAFLATEVGVWSTADLSAGSVDWSPTNTGLANVRTDMLQYRSADRTIMAATHGRGVFTTVIPAPQAPVAAFSGTPTTLCEGNTVTFTDASTNSPTSWVWSFPGGTPSSHNGQTPPAITYSTAGTYNVSLTVSNVHGSDPEVKNNYITVNAVPGNAGAITGSTSECENATGIAYSIAAVTGATSYNWTVPSGATVASGQGTTSITVNFGTSSGNVSVTPSNSCGNGGSNSKAVTINVCGNPPVAAFSGTPTTLCEGSTVTFTDASTNSPTSWVWSFPGGTPSSHNGQTPPAITYATAGNYDVTLTVTNAFGSDPEVKTNYITVNACGLTELKPPFRKTYLAYHEIVACYPVTNAQEYEFAFTPALGGPTITYTRGIPNHSFYLDWVTGLADGTTYDVKVRAKVGGVYGAYGNIHQLTTPGVAALTSVVSPDCGKVFTSYAENLGCYSVSNAQDYEFEFKPTLGGPTITYSRGIATNSIVLNMVSGLADNTMYDVRVRAKVSGVFGPYGNMCQITTPAAGANSTSLKPNFCKVYTSFTQVVACYEVVGATDYEWQFTPTLGGPPITFNRNLPYNSILLNMVTGLALNTQYDVRVRPYIGSWGTYGSMCQITTPPTARMVVDGENEDPELVEDASTANKLEVTIYPNPGQGEFVYMDLDGLAANSSVVVTDIFGKTILNKPIESDYGTYSGTLRFDQRLSSGFYMITVISNDQKITKKLVVR